MKTAIIGGGIIGLSTALELRGAGLDVTVFDTSPSGTRASDAAGGMLAPQKEAHAPGPFLDVCLMSRTIWPAFAAKVAAASGHPSTYRESGILTAAFTDDELHALDATAAWQHACHLRVEQLPPAEARRLAPALSPDVVGAAFFPDEHQVDPIAFMPALRDACRKAGVAFVSAKVEAITEVHGRATGVHAGNAYPADHVVLAAGAWSSLFGAVPTDLVAPVRGQMLELRPAELPASILSAAGCYLIPRTDGRLVVGSTEERTGFVCENNDASIARLRAAVNRLCPSLAEVPTARAWAGLRPWASFDLPVLGPGPWQNLQLATGHFRNGILLAPLTARLVRQQILGQRSSVDLKPFRYDRNQP